MTPVLNVEVDMFSGRPNPRLRLGDGEATRLHALIARQRSVLNDVRTADQLGFRGFIVTNENTGEIYRVRGRVLQMGEKTYLDRNGEIQSYVLSILPQDVRAMLLPLLDAR
ncbi:hypothetical protein G8O24_16220 [Bradyrhizobium sp. INPA01-394B]|uniref:Uncharacterized protein n=1 Tax=Bradyrhizobium campsiandrae TaxID=1729892 RepID=A0ABR7UAF0_9BRAD|nr:hypothetical protein [Bradyrhizobium campsiandrae]MBC9878886.1 hypothetical protein [Bradyrhizobium campsiandrae]MBC9980853.1 hypothetical protein [Bradyrhizobium campsiandrae]